MTLPIIIYGSNLILLIIGTILPITFFIIVCMNLRPLTSNVLLILTSNTYLSLILTSLTLFDGCLCSFLSNLIPGITPGLFFCQIRIYISLVALTGVTYSFVLQALFRLFRIVFHQKQNLRSLRVFSIIILFQWLFILLINLCYVFLKDIEYLPSEYRCSIPLTNFRGATMLIIITYALPINMIFSIYFYIIRYIRRTTNAMNIRQHTTKRDMIVFKRIIYLFLVLQIFSIPLSVIWIMYMITGYETVWSYYIQMMSGSLSQIIVSLVLASTTPKIREKFQWRQRQVHPGVEIRVRRRNTEELVQPNVKQ